MAQTLGLDGDGDDVELLEDLEMAFGTRFTQAECATFMTVGDIYEALRRRYRSGGEGGSRCATAMTFYRLRRALGALGVTARLRPATDLRGLTRMAPKHVVRQLQSRSGLALPAAHLTAMGLSGIALIALGAVGLMAVGHAAPVWWLVPPGAAVAGMLALRPDRGQFPDTCRTMGDLARSAAAQNFARLVAEGARHHDRDVWNALVDVLHRHAEVARGEISPGTLILASVNGA